MAKDRLTAPLTPEEALKIVLDRLRRGLKRLQIRIASRNKINMTASLGVTALSPDAPLRDALECADKAMYSAKNAGRDRVHIWERKKKKA